MRNHTNGHKVKHGTITVILTVLIVVSAIVINATVSTLAKRFSWYIDMDRTGAIIYSISENCEKYLEQNIAGTIREKNAGKLTLLFCNEEEAVESDSTLKYVLFTAREMQEKFSDALEIKFVNVWEQPSIGKKYGVKSPTDVVIIYEDRNTTVRLHDFFVFSASDSTTPIAYNGERRLTSGMLRVVCENTPMCYFTINHGETIEDYELMSLVADCGYNFSYLDLLNDEIPSDCDLLVTYNPNRDLTVSDGVSTLDETAKLEAYLNNGGKYMVFASADTFVSGVHANLEAFLEKWGVTYDHKTGDDGIEQCYNIKDNWHSLTNDGYTVIGQPTAASALLGASKPNVFANATSISPAEGYVADGQNNYTATVNGRTRNMSALMYSYDTAEAWAAGRAVARADKDPFIFMTMTEQKCENGENAYLVACSSTEFASEEYMQSIVYGNSDTIASIVRYMGKSDAPTNLLSKPFYSPTIESITTSQADIITVVLVLVPALVAAISGIIILVRRKYS